MNKLEVTKYVLGVVMIQQYSLNAGLNKFGKGEQSEVTKELAKLHEMNAFTQLRKEEKKDLIISLMFLADKRDGSINGRACVDVRGQRGKFKK